MKKLVFVLLLIAAPAFAQLTNQTALLEAVKRDHPAAWSCAHTDRPCAWDYIKLVACRLNPTGFGPWGLNGRRGDPSPARMSWDALNYCGQGPASDPTHACGSPLTIVDVIVSAGAPNASVTWQPFTTDPTPGAWIRPTGCAAAPTPTPTPPVVVVPSYPGDPVGNLIGLALFADYAEKGEAPNSGMLIWGWRCAWDMAVNRLPPDVAIAKHRAVWRAALGLPPVP